MVEITRYPFLRHLRADPSSHMIQFRKGRKVRSGRGVAFWFQPLSTSLVEVPVDDREQTFLCTGRSADFQELTVQGVLTCRVKDPETLANRIDFGVDLGTGRYLKEPLEQLTAMVTQLAQQIVLEYLAHAEIRTVLEEGVSAIRTRIEAGLRQGEELADLGIELVSIRVAKIAPTAEMEKALQAPTREGIQQTADQAVFQRRALAVEKERAIEENELQNKIEIARQEAQFIAQQGTNERKRAEDAAQAAEIAAAAKAERQRLHAVAEADSIAAIERSRNDAEKARIEIYRDLPSAVLMGLAAREAASKLQSIEHLNIAPDMFGPMLQNLIQAGTNKLEG